MKLYTAPAAAAARHIHTIDLSGITCHLLLHAGQKLATFAIEGTEATSWTVAGPIDLQMLFADQVEETLAQAQHTTHIHAGLLAHTLDWYGTTAILITPENGMGDAFMLLPAGSMGDEYDAHDIAATLALPTVA